jgi:tRNA 2-selenouridine synthase
MAVSRVTAADALARLASFHTLIDARSQSEYAEDHLPGAVNWPSLNDAERHAVGTEYKQVSAFDAKKRGAALVARNIAGHIEREAMAKPKDWRPLVYCWRGGQRSGALATVLGQIGWQVELLDGGYRAYRRAVISELERLPQTLDLRVVCGTTGSGKSRLLRALRDQGEQVLDLEELANHRGSVLGLVPGQEQPGQKMFESLLWGRLRGFDASRRVWVESESRRVGDVQVPTGLVQRMRAAPCVVLELPLEERVALLLREYRHFVDDIDAFCVRLDALRALRGHEVINAWQENARAGRVADVVRELLVTHYDPVYVQSMRRNFPGFSQALLQLHWDGSDESLLAGVRSLVALPATAGHAVGSTLQAAFSRSSNPSPGSNAPQESSSPGSAHVQSAVD